MVHDSRVREVTNLVEDIQYPFFDALVLGTEGIAPVQLIQKVNGVFTGRHIPDRVSGDFAKDLGYPPFGIQRSHNTVLQILGG